jgi:polysaccharide biosynthesis transport protein
MNIVATSKVFPQDRLGATISPSQILGLVRGHAPTMLLCALILALAGYGLAKVQPPYYTAFGSIALEGQTFAIPELQGAVRNENMPDPMPLVRTEEQALLSRQLVRAVIDKLSIEDVPEFNPALRPPTIMQRIKDAFRSKARSILESQPSPEMPDGPKQVVEEEVMRALMITQDNRSLVIGVGFTSRDPELAAHFVNMLIQDYVGERAKRRLAANQGANTAMLQQIDDVRSDLAKLEQQIRDLRTKGDIVNLPAGSVGQQQLEELATAASRAGIERAQIEAQWQQASALARQGASAELSTVLNSPTIATLRQQESQASQKLADLTSRYGSDYPTVRSAQADLAAVRGQLAREMQRIVSSLDAQLSVARAHEADAQKQLVAAKRKGVQGENAEAEMADLQKEVVAHQALYESLLRGEQQTIAQATSNGMSVDVRVLDNAVPPVFPSGPNTKLAAGMGGGAGLFVGLLIGFVRVRSADKFPTADEVTAATGLTVATVVPRRRGKMPFVSRVRLNPDGEEAEALRLLRACLRSQASVPRSVLFASVDDERGAADLATAFAYVASGDGARVIVVEGELQNPQIASLLGVAKADLLPVLEGNGDWRDNLLSDRSANLDLLLTHERAPASHALLSGPRFQNLMIDLDGSYNIVVLNAPSAETADALTLAFRTDVTVLVVDVAKAKQTAVREAVSRLSTAVHVPPVVAMIVRC